MKFKTSILEYRGDSSGPALFGIKEILECEACPEHTDGCEYGMFLDSCGSIGA